MCVVCLSAIFPKIFIYCIILAIIVTSIFIGAHVQHGYLACVYLSVYTHKPSNRAAHVTVTDTAALKAEVVELKSSLDLANKKLVATSQEPIPSAGGARTKWTAMVKRNAKSRKPNGRDHKQQPKSTPSGNGMASYLKLKQPE